MKTYSRYRVGPFEFGRRGAEGGRHQGSKFFKVGRLTLQGKPLTPRKYARTDDEKRAVLAGAIAVFTIIGAMIWITRRGT